MTRTPNHGYNLPEKGAENWHVPLNENFEQYDTDIEVRDEVANLADYDPADGAKFLATDTGVVYVGNGSEWIATLQAGRYNPSSGGENGGSVAFGDPENDASGGDAAAVGGGTDNQASGDAAVVSGGEANTASSIRSTVSGGQENDASGQFASIGGGWGNVASDKRATVAGGRDNVADADQATVGGGLRNEASGSFSTIPGGVDNVATGKYSFAGGRKARAEHVGTFVWADSGESFTSTGPTQFLVDAAGGVGIGTDDPNAEFHIRGEYDPARVPFQIGDDGHRMFASVIPDDGASVVRAQGTDDEGRQRLVLGAGNSNIMEVNDGGQDYLDGVFPTEGDRYFLGALGERWESVEGKEMWAEEYNEYSDARLKTNVSALEDGLDAVNDLRPVTFDWTDGPERGRQIGLIAQEVAEVLPELVKNRDISANSSEEYLSVSYTKLVPVLVDALQEQQEVIEEHEERIAELEAENERDADRIDALEERIEGLEGLVEPASATPADD